MSAALWRSRAEGVLRPSSRLNLFGLEAALLAWLLALTYRHRWVMDDATIYFRYIDNWLFLGRGPVFNAGEHVEGYTSPLWLLLLAAVRQLPFDYWTLTLSLGLTCALASGLACIALGRRLSPGLRRANLPLALLAGHYGVQTHFTGGLETGLVQCFGVLTALWLSAPHTRWLSCLLGLMPLVRPELALVLACMGGLYLWRFRTLPWPLFASAGLTTGAWLVFRVGYYADLLPNTFYLKAESSWAQGLNYLALEAGGAWGVVLAAAMAVVVARWRDRPAPIAGGFEFPRACMLGLAGVSVLWTVRIGGDMAYHRFFAFAFALACCATAGLLEQAMRGRPDWLRRAAVVIAFGLSAASYPQTVLSAHPLTAGVESLQWRGIEDALWHRRHHDLRYGPARLAEDARLRRHYGAARPNAAHAKLAIKAWCHWAFVRPDTHVIHTYGLTDAVLARVDAHTRRPGHRNLWYQARDLLEAHKAVPRAKRGQQVYALAAARNRVAPWLRHALPTVELIQRKVHNRHDPIENLRLALSPVPRIAP